MIRYIKLLNDKNVRIRLIIFAIGFSPIASLSLSTFNLVPLYIAGPFVVLPAILGAFVIGSVFPRYRRTLIRGFLLGVCAVFLYDLTCRFPFIIAGVWPDFIPKIGNYLLRQGHVHWSVGYLWRYIGNGGGMGLAFYAVYPLVGLRAKSTKVGTIYGISIFCCALITIYCSPSGRIYLFNPTLLTAFFGLMGHVVFGYVLGYGVKLFPDQALRVTTKPPDAPLALSADLAHSLPERSSFSYQDAENRESA
jgi:hypothetical protein